MTKNLTEIPEFIKEIPSTMEFSANEAKIIVTNNLSNSTIILNENSKIYFVTLLTEGWEETKKINFHFKGKGAELHFLSLILAEGDHKFLFETNSIHEVPETNAYYYVRTTMFDRSRVNYRGCLIIKPGAQITDSYLGHYTLMLSKEAKSETIPSLEIEADDVKAGHAATFGRVDEEMLHYMQSRGIDKKTAQNMLIKGFIEADLHRIPSEEVRLAITNSIEQKINKNLAALC